MLDFSTIFLFFCSITVAVLLIDYTTAYNEAVSSSQKLYKCLKLYKTGHHFDCSTNHDRLCCTFFKSSKKRRGFYRRSKNLKNNQIPDLNFKIDFDSHDEQNHDVITNEIQTGDTDDIFKSGQRRGIVLNETDSSNNVDEKIPNDILEGSRGYNQELCAQLRVPCRFVNDHPCCTYEMPLDLVARSRALDGSADLKWRPVSLGGPRTASHGRSLFRTLWSSSLTTLPPAIFNKNIKYNYAVNKKKVSIPNYHYDGGPEMTGTIVGLCWRLHYVTCPKEPHHVFDKLENKWTERRRQTQKVHPCCQLVRKPSLSSSPIGSRVSRWLQNPSSV